MKDALQSVSQFDLVAVTPTDEIRLVRRGRVSTLARNLFSVGTTEYLYATGYVTSPKAYPHGRATSAANCRSPRRFGSAFYCQRAATHSGAHAGYSAQLRGDVPDYDQI